MSDLYTKAKSALEEASDWLDDEDYDSLAQLVDLFKPTPGDVTGDFLSLSPVTSQCGTCLYEEVAFFTPISLSNLAKITQRRSVCPRCGENVKINLGEFTQ